MQNIENGEEFFFLQKHLLLFTNKKYGICDKFSSIEKFDLLLADNYLGVMS